MEKFDFTASFQRTVAQFDRLSPGAKADYERTREKERRDRILTEMIEADQRDGLL